MEMMTGFGPAIRTILEPDTWWKVWFENGPDDRAETVKVDTMQTSLYNLDCDVTNELPIKHTCFVTTFIEGEELKKENVLTPFHYEGQAIACTRDILTLANRDI